MPRTALPPTPASSTDIHGKDGSKQLSNLQMAFELPPAAMIHDSTPSTMTMPASPISQASHGKPYPIQPSETVKARRRSAAATAAAASAAKEDTQFALPPPPTRSRKIIQMKPRQQQQQEEKNKKAASEPAIVLAGSARGSNKKPPVATPAAGETISSKKKQPSATSAAGRKIARKTAHSLIERRRRSKMNEEFGVLKGMIPACTGEMHKLAILQASIEYVRYLQDCIEKLKSQREQESAQNVGVPASPEQEAFSPKHTFQQQQQQESVDAEEELQPDVEMTGSDIVGSPVSVTHSAASSAMSPQRPSPSPALAAQDAHSYPSPASRRKDSYTSISTTAMIQPAAAVAEHHRHYSFHSVTVSPAVGPGWGFGLPGGSAAATAAHYAASNHSALTSPALGPLREWDLDQEATAALLMLNADRRGTVSSSTGGAGAGGGGGPVSSSHNIGAGGRTSSSSGPARGMSVRDLLSS